MTRIVIAVLLIALAAPVVANTAAADSTILAIQSMVGELREKPFLTTVPVRDQGVEAFGAYLDAELAKQIPDDLAADYDAVVRAVGLYRGPVIDDYRATMKAVMLSQAAAYYDPATEAFYVVMGDMPDQLFRPVVAHEITHGLQDQYFDLDAFVLAPSAGGLNDDELNARAAVVEGEATYVMTLFSVYDMLGMVPDRALLGPAVALQAGMSTDQLKQMMAMPQGGVDLGPDMAAALEAMDTIPAFIMETMVGAYLKGCAFVYDVQGQGWSAVDSLYTHPPVSTEQILHPEKYAAGEAPSAFTDVGDAGGLLADWRLLRANTLGELQWRIVFAEHGQGDIAIPLAEGWDGDRYAVYERDGATLLLLATHWDTENDAADFEAGYHEVLAAKELPEGVAGLIERRGRYVGIVEGGNGELAAEALAYLATTLAKSGK